MSTNTENTRWGIAASTPPLNPAEVESHHRAIEVVVMWGQNVLAVEHASPPRDVRVETRGATYPVVVERDGRLLCVLPEGAEGDVEVDGQKASLEELRGRGLASFDELAGALLYPLPDGASARVSHDGLTFLVRPTHAGKELGTGAEVRWNRYGWVAASLGVHAIVLGMFYFLPPSTQALSLDQITAQDRMVEYLDTANAVEDPDEPEWANEAGPEGGTGQRAADEEGAAGDPEEAVTGRRMAVQGRADNPSPTMPRESIRENMANIGAIGAVASLMGTFNAPTSPYGADNAEGLDAMSAIGQLMGDDIGNSFGYGGLGMNGTGRGAGGTGLGTYGLGRLGTLGHGDGDGDRNGYGNSVGGLRGERRTRVPRVRPSNFSTTGSISREAIRRVVQRNLSQVRFCYEQGLQQNPSIEGRVTISWIITPTGAVQASSVQSSTLNNARVETCIANAVSRWSFPSPDGGGVVGVNYPFLLQSPN